MRPQRDGLICLTLLGLAPLAACDEEGEKPAATCSAETPICDPACGDDATCTFADGTCSCEADAPTCSAATPVCDPTCGAGTTCTFDDGTCGCVADAPTCSAATPVCDPTCGAGTTCTFADDACSCVADAPTCSAATPVCDPACGAGTTCTFADDACSCVADAPTCTELAPVCDPTCGAAEACTYVDGACECQTICVEGAEVCTEGGPNDGCPTGKVCGAGCVCFDEPDDCNEEAPECEGNGPNNGCATDQFCNGATGCTCEAIPAPPARLLRASRSTAVDIDIADQTVAMVNTDDGSLSLFRDLSAATPTKVTVPTSSVAQSEPMSVVIHPDGKTAFVANRAAGSVSKIVGIDTATPTIAVEKPLGAEPIQLALSPTGATLVVSDWVNGTVSFLATSDLATTRTVDVGRNPYAIAVTNDGDDVDSDEKALVTEFFGRPEGKETDDEGRKGYVHVLPLDGSAAREIALAPLAACFTGDLKGSEVTTACFPNQLHGIAIHTAFGKTRAFVVSVAASPEGPVGFNHNVQALVSVIDVAAEAEETALTTNLNQRVKLDQPDTDGDDNLGRRFINTPVAIAFPSNPNANFGYVAAAGSDIVLRVVFAEGGTVTVGSGINFNIPVGQNPQGIVTRHKTGPDAFVANLISRNLSVVSFGDQAVTKTVASTTQPAEGTDAFKVWKGKRFFNTATGIWSKEGWGSCQACHFLGLSDNVTWSFAAGPRQTISMDGQYASNDPTDMRALNWTAIFDETHDFENNTRGVSGGKGAIQKADGSPVVNPAGGPAFFGAITAEDGATVENHQALNGSMKHLTRTAAICGNTATCPDWDLIDRYVQSIRSPRGKTNSAGDVENGRQIFADGGCAKCHAGPKWTVSRTFYEPEVFTGSLPTRKFEVQRAFETTEDGTKLQTLPDDVNPDTTLVAGNDGTGAVALRRLACNLRAVGTFGAEGGSAEVRENGTEAQGAKGFNPPSLLGLALSAPYFHNGAAQTLVDVFDARFEDHLIAGNPNFLPTASDKADLVAFLLSIDETTAPFDIAADTQLCPLDFTPE